MSDTDGSGSGFFNLTETTTIPIYNISNMSLDNSTNSSYGPLEAPEGDLFTELLGIWITGVFCLLGFTGNILSFIVLLRAFGRSPMFCVLRAVSISDAIFLLIVFFLQWVVNVYPRTGLFR